MKKHRVLIPLDESNISLNILPSIKKLLQPQDVELVFYHVTDSPKPVKSASWTTYRAESQAFMYPEPQTHETAPPIYMSQIEDTKQNNLESAFYLKSRLLREAGYSVSVVVEFGHPAEKILAYIDTHDIDLIAMTTHAREGINRLLFGSVAEKVLHHVHIPVLLLHPASQGMN